MKEVLMFTEKEKQNISVIEKLKAIKTRISVEKKAQKVLKRQNNLSFFIILIYNN